jgi:hypothetical protein
MDKYVPEEANIVYIRDALEKVATSTEDALTRCISASRTLNKLLINDEPLFPQDAWALFRKLAETTDEQLQNSSCREQFLRDLWNLYWNVQEPSE